LSPPFIPAYRAVHTARRVDRIAVAEETFLLEFDEEILAVLLAIARVHGLEDVVQSRLEAEQFRTLDRLRR
jgi:hypothetical protein